jgi:hypothetical protein
LTPSELGRHLGLSASATASLLAILALDGKVSRSPSADRQRGDEGDDERRVRQSDRAALAWRQRVVARHRIAPALDEGVETDGEDDEQQRRRGHQQRDHPHGVADQPVPPREGAGDATAVDLLWSRAYKSDGAGVAVVCGRLPIVRAAQ